MKIPRYWAKSNLPPPGGGGRPNSVSCWRWSNVSVSDAQHQADARAIELARMFEAGTELNRYGYGDRALREEIIQTVASNAQSDVAIVTRNAYGALVLNTSSVMFIDVDFAAGA